MSCRRRGRGERPGTVLSVHAGLAHKRALLGRHVSRWIAGRAAPYYPPGDMRRSYRWTRRAAILVLSAIALVLTGRLVLIGLFVNHVSGELPLIAVFNIGLTATVASLLVGVAIARGWLRRWYRYRVVRGTAPPPKPL